MENAYVAIHGHSGYEYRLAREPVIDVFLHGRWVEEFEAEGDVKTAIERRETAIASSASRRGPSPRSSGG